MYLYQIIGMDTCIVEFCCQQPTLTRNNSSMLNYIWVTIRYYAVLQKGERFNCFNIMSIYSFDRSILVHTFFGFNLNNLMSM